jgi:hypothetical protein
MIYFAGLDVSLRTVNICVVDDEGEPVAEIELASDVQDIVAYLDDLGVYIESVGIEAGTLTTASNQCLQRLATTSTDCEEKRDPRQDATNTMPCLLVA